MPSVMSNLNMQGSRMRGLSTAVNPDEPMRKGDIQTGKRIYKNTNISGAITIDWSLYDEVRLTVTGNTTLTFTGAVDGQGCVLKLKQDSTGGHTVALPSNIRYSIDMRTYSVIGNANGVDRLGFIYDSDDSKYDFISAVRNLV